MFKALVLAVSLGFASFASFAGSGAADPELTPKDARAVRAVVEAQLKALANQNSTLAFAYATPEIRHRFRDAGQFFEMVRGSYPMLIRPASVSFMRPEAGHGVVVQAVQFRDRDGHLWRALYELQRQSDRTWRINGCAVAADDESSTT